MSSISSLEAELSRQRAINNELRNQIAEIASCVGNAYHRVEKCNNLICNTLDKGSKNLQDSNRKSLAAIETQIEIDAMYTRFKQMELANKKIRKCNDKKYYDFAVFRSVRKLVQGLMDNLDLNMVSDAVIYKSIEESHLKQPNYWLTCVLLAIMAWKNDDRELADRSIDLALKLDKKKSSIFFMLFTLRMKRDQAALKWFLTYKDCELQGSDQRVFLLLFTLMNKTINSSENMNEQTREDIKSYINKIIEDNVSSDDYSEDEIVERALAYYHRMDSREIPSYPLLSAHSSSYSKLSRVLMQAKGNIAILEFVKSVLNTDTVKKNEFVKKFIDEIVAEANSEEKDVYNEIRYNELIIEYEGDVERAKEVYDSEIQHDENKLNLISEMIEWIFTADDEELDSQGRLNMFNLTKDIHKKAIAKHTEQYRNVDTNSLEIKIDDYQTNANMSDASGEKHKIASYYEKIRDENCAGVKNIVAYISFGLGVAAAVASPFVNWMLLILTAVGALVGGVILYSNSKKIKNFGIKCEHDIAAASEVFDKISQEHKALLEQLKEYDAYTQDITAELEQI